MEIDLGIDKIQGKSVKQMIEWWKPRVELNESVGPFSMFYIAGSDQKQEEAINYLAQQLDIGKDDRITVDNERQKRDLVVDLHNIINEVKLLKGKRVLIIAKGFEKMFVGKIEEYRQGTFYRLGHDWEQTLLDNDDSTFVGNPYREMGKHLVIVTTIGFSHGSEVYENAIKSAIGSGYKMGIIELGK